jgi:leader peptidase (prepilin peptidase)/N-methyltransferase
VVIVFIFLFGLIIGSFLNVCILRIPQGKSIVLPASSCPGCGAAIRAYDNIPVLSWIFLRGRCRKCGKPISIQYPVVELLSGILFVGCYLAFGLSLPALKWAVFSALILVLTVTDLRERILPDKVNFFGIAAGLLFSLVVPVGDGTAAWLADRLFAFPPSDTVISFADAVIGSVGAGGFLWLVAEGYFRLRGREGMGLGDVKMIAMAGAFLGLQGVLLMILLGSLIGSVIGVAVVGLWRKGRDFELPFGTFLGAAAIVVVFCGMQAIAWYRSLFHYA